MESPDASVPTSVVDSTGERPPGVTAPPLDGPTGAARPPADAAGAVSDGTLVLRAAAGERAAFDDLIRRYQRQAVAVAYRLLGNTPDALEVTQDAFLRAYKGIATLQKPEAFGGWLLRIVSNLSLNDRRNRKNRRSTLPLDDLLGGETGGSEGLGGDRSAGGGRPAPPPAGPGTRPAAPGGPGQAAGQAAAGTTAVHGRGDASEGRGRAVEL